ncbi:unnamed protein product [Calypogeia fissa]
MANTAVASGLMSHQKDEHDIWICKDCGWKYPNAKPSPKIRKHHRKQCPGKAGANAHAPGGSSDEASDDEHHHHHSPLQASVAPKETAAEVAAPPMETQSRELDLASLKEDSKEEAAPPAEAPVVNGTAKEAQAHEEAAIPAAVPVSASGLMPHQKDEHDVWVCKACGWKYPNARPSPKIRKHHKKNCPGTGGAVHAGGSSDEASDDEHHHAPAPLAAAVESARDESVSSAPPPAETPTSISREIDFAALKEAPTPEVTEGTPAADISPEAGNETKEFSPAAADSTEEKAVPLEALAPESAVPAAVTGSGLMLHQKDEFDVWICKDCGWKYPNAKPSAKIRKNHKKKCTGKTSGAGPTGGSSDEASDDEHHGHHGHHLSSLAPPVAPVEIPAAVETGKEDPAAAPEVPESTSRDIDFGALKESSATSREETTPAFSATETPTEDAGAVSLKEAISKETDKEKGAPKRALSLQEAIDKETAREKESATSTGGSDGLLLHQKDESDVWICKECGWKYPNARPSPKIRNNHKKKCPGHTGNGVPVNGATHDEADNEHDSTAETVTEKDVKDSVPAASEAEVTDTQIQSREFSLQDALQTSDAPPASDEKAVEEKEAPAKAEPEPTAPTTIGGLMPHQKDEADIWVCKECGWRYPNAKPSAKIRKNHKKKCRKRVGAAKATNGGSSDGSSSEDESKIKGGKCFPCL